MEHLHKLQSENRTMQSRIMELASQREFYIAINTRLRQTLVDGTTSQVPNGLQTSSEGLAQSSAANSTHQVSSPDFYRSASGERVSLPSPSPSLPAPSSAGSLSKQDQESLLHAHFLASSLPANYQQPPPSHTTPSNAHHSVRGGMEGQQCIPSHSFGPREQLPHNHQSPADDERMNEAMYNAPHQAPNAAPLPPHPVPYLPVPVAISELDTLTGEHPQASHIQNKH